MNLVTEASAPKELSLSIRSLNDYYSASQLRSDRWASLKNVAYQLGLNNCNDTHESRKAELRQQAEQLLSLLHGVEDYWAFPGRRGLDQLGRLLTKNSYEEFARIVGQYARTLSTGAYRKMAADVNVDTIHDNDVAVDNFEQPTQSGNPPYFEVLVVDGLAANQQEIQRQSLRSKRREDDEFIYDVVFVPSFEDALIAILFNYNIQSVVIRYDFEFQSANSAPIMQRYLRQSSVQNFADLDRSRYGLILCKVIKSLRPELDVFMVTDQSVEQIAGANLYGCARVFYNQEDYTELHLNLLRGVSKRYETPFFNALKEYSKKPTGVFHAMPISRGKSILRSHWIQDMGDFYGMNIFLAETSATSGGLDSLLEPQGPIKRAQEMAARAFGARQTFFATNGTSTCNKIVVQAMVRPGDIVLVDRDCHKSHHYGMVLSGAHVQYLDSYPLNEYSMYGAVPLHEIKRELLRYKAAGKLDRVRMLLLTNCTFDGIVYNVERVMEECLAIKPDLVFLWDEAWFAFARFGPTYRYRTAMNAANTLREKYKSEAYQQQYQAYVQRMDGATDEQLVKQRLMPDPARVRIRTYATQSTHKTLTSLRQGSMIHVNDQDFKGDAMQAFHEAYMTHTSTSPNYQIIASLDVGRRQVELEGYELMQKQIEAAMTMRKSIDSHPLLKKYFKVLSVKELIPAAYRESGVESYWDAEKGWNDIADAWAVDEFALDASRVTLLVGGAGMDGDTFKNAELMNKHGIQINKTSRNTVLFMTNIGTTRSSIAYLIEVLVKIASEIDERLEEGSALERKHFDDKVHSLINDYPPLPDFSRFHPAFCNKENGENAAQSTQEGDIRQAYFMAYNADNCEYFSIHDDGIDKAIASGRMLVSTSFIIPYPPGFPILVPGQVISIDIIQFMRALDVKEIHGYRADLGLRVFTEKALTNA